MVFTETDAIIKIRKYSRWLPFSKCPHVPYVLLDCLLASSFLILEVQN
jgi:hypothetical protein